MRSALDRDPSHPLFEMSTKLITSDPDLASMWSSLEKKKKTSDEMWVWTFLKTALHASRLPRYHYLSHAERRHLSERIARFGALLRRELEANELSAHLVYLNSRIFEGVFIFEDCSPRMRKEIVTAGVRKLGVGSVIEEVCERARRLIEEEPQAGKAGKSVKLVRFVRLLAALNFSRYEGPLSAEIATAARAIFQTEYTAKDVTMLLSRPPSQRSVKKL